MRIRAAGPLDRPRATARWPSGSRRRASGCCELGIRRRRPGRDPVGEPAGVGHRGLRLPCRAMHRRADLSHASRPSGRVHPARLRRRGGPGLLRRPSSRKRSRSATGCRRCGTSSRSTRTCAGRTCSASESCWPAGARRSHAHPDWRAHALGAGPDDLATLIYTSGHHRRPQGRDADAREHRVQRHQLLSGCSISARATSASPSCRCRTSSSGCSGITRCSTPAC